jgi:ferredoxin
MIVADLKPIENIMSYLEGKERILLAGCHGCVTVCSAGGQKEVALLASMIELARRRKGQSCSITQMTLERQCDPEFLEEELLEKAKEHDVVLSMACAVGTQMIAEHVETGIKVFPAVDTLFMGGVDEKGQWSERCQGCGDCKLALTGGICPITRCSKSLLNGPCGGSRDGICEVDPNIKCGWQMIIDRLEAIGCLDDFEKIIEPADWSKAFHGGPRKYIRPDMR